MMVAKILRVFISVILIGLSFAQAQNNWVNPQGPWGILDGPITNGEYFGSDVAISGDYAVAGAPGHDFDAQGSNALSGAGAVFVYKKTGGTWSFYQKLVAADRAQSDAFGSTVAIHGNFIIVGCPNDAEDENGNNFMYAAGSVYVFRLNAGVWQQQQRLVAPDRDAGDRFGWACDIDSDYIVAGALWENRDANNQDSLSEAGAAYVFKQAAGVWTLQQKITPADRAAEDRFAQQVAISGDRIICGAMNQDLDANGANPATEAGAAYVFKRTGTVWALEQKLVNLDRSSNGWFGYSVDIDGDRAVIAADGIVTDENNENPIPNAGAAYVFVRTAYGWVQQSKLVPADRQLNHDFFGTDVAIDGDYVLVGMQQDDGSNGYNRAGSAYVYTFNGRWQQTQKLTSYFPFTDYGFGNAVDIDGPNILIGESGYDDLNNSSQVGDIYFFTTAPLAINVHGTAASCTAAADGSADITITGGYAPYQVTLGTKHLTTSGTIYGLGAGTYAVTVTDALNASVSQNVTIAQGGQACAGSLVLEADTAINYFDTITVHVSLKDADNLFSVYAKLHFDSSLLNMISYKEEGFFGTTNIITTPPVITNGTIDFGITKTAGQAGANGDGAFFTFRFLLKKFPANVPFYYLNPDSIATLFTLNNLTVYDATGVQRNLEMPAPAVTWLRYYIPVWPGDLNADYQVNVADILPIGYFYNNSGPARPNASLQWVKQQAQLWGFERTTRNSSGYKVFADGNGNGLIDLADQSAIGFNLSKVHALVAPAEPDYSRAQGAPEITAEIAPVQIDSTQLPATLTIPVRIGSSFNPVNNLYGVAFDMLFNPQYVDTNTIQLDFSNTVFGTQNVDYIRIEDLHPGDGRLSVGITRYNTTELYCAGDEIVKVRLTIKPQVPTGWFRFTTIPLDASNLAGDNIELSGSRDSVYIITSIPNGMAEVNAPLQLNIFPNPGTSGNFTLTYEQWNTVPDKLTVYTMEGKELFSEKINAGSLSSGKIMFQLNDVANGIYLVKLQLNDGRSETVKLCINQ